MSDIEKAAMQYFAIVGDIYPSPKSKEWLTKIINEQVEKAHASHKVICKLETCSDYAGYASSPCIYCKHRSDRELIAKFEVALKISEEENKRWKEKDRVARSDPRRAAIFDWLNEHTDESVKTLSDQNGEMENEIIKLQEALKKADDLRTATFSLLSWYGEPSVCIDCNPVDGKHERDCGVSEDIEFVQDTMDTYQSARSEVKL